jgi:sulfur oxidation c-type cytochrome SoxX
MFLSTCKGQEKKPNTKAGINKNESLADYKTGDKFDAKKIFTDINPEPVKYSYPKGMKGDPKKGRKIFSNTKTGNCAACHCTEHAKGCGNIGFSLTKYRSKLGANKTEKNDDWLFQTIADKRYTTKSTVMPPSLSTKVLSKQDIVDVVAYLNTLK